MKRDRIPLLQVLVVAASALLWTVRAAEPLTTLQYRVEGASLEVSPAVLSVPKGIGGSISAVVRGGGDSLVNGSFVEATLRGPSFPARRVVGETGKPLLLPPLPLEGDYELNGIRLVDAATGTTRLAGNPATVKVHVFGEVLVSRVTSRPLSLDEIREKGIAIDETNFRAVEFEVGFVLDGKTIPVKFPVVAPKFDQSTEIVPAAELAAKLQRAQAINEQLGGAALPKELEAAGLNIEVKGINFQFVDPNDAPDLALKVPPIPALVVIPGNIGFLNQFFSVMIFTENAAPAGSGLLATNVQAQLVLPAGPDRVPGTYQAPGDDPLRMARTGGGAIISTVLPVVKPGADGIFGTPDDNPRLAPGETGQAEFLVEGLQEGLHIMDIKLTADLQGLAAGTVKITGAASGSVLVRNPKFSLAFSHPRTIRAGEPYEALVTVLNTSDAPANLVNVTLRDSSISGGRLESPETVELGTIAPGQTATAKYQVRSQRTGSITFSNLSTSDDSLVGRFRLSMGIDERGVALSADTIAPPDFVNDLPPALLDAANRVLGQALSVATAGRLPAGVLTIGRSVVTQKVLELAEAGQRLRYGDTADRVLPDLLLDWLGGRSFDAGFDQIVRSTDAGREFREALMHELENADSSSAVARLASDGPDLAGRGEAWWIAASGNSALGISTVFTGAEATLDTSSRAQTAGFRGARGNWASAAPGTDVVFKWSTTTPLPSADLSLLLLNNNGTGTRLTWNLGNLPAGACATYRPGAGDGMLALDLECDGTVDLTIAATVVPVVEAPPRLIAVMQDPTVLAGRPAKMCDLTQFQNYGTVLAVLFSKPMTQEKVGNPAAYSLENGNTAGSVQIQPGGRVALLNMRAPVGALRPRTMTVTGVTDPRGQVIAGAAKPVVTSLGAGIAVRGKVVRSDGTLAALVPVTLTIFDQEESGLGGCLPFTVRVSQVFTDGEGGFDFDFVLAGLPYSVSATDTSGLSLEAVQIILDSGAGEALSRQKLLELAASPSVQSTLLSSFAVGALSEAVVAAEGLDRAVLRDLVAPDSARVGTEVPVALRFRGRGTVTGVVVGADGVTPEPGVAVNLFPDPDSRELGRGVFSDNGGRFSFPGVPLGSFTVSAASNSGLFRTITDTLDTAGETKTIQVILAAAVGPRTDLRGFVTEGDNVTPHNRAQVFVGKYDLATGKFGSVVAAVLTDETGFWTATGIPVRTYDVVAVSSDSRRKGERRDVAAVSGSTNQVNIALQGFGVVTGFVQKSDGTPVPNALVAGGEALVRTDNSGAFRLTGVPTGQRSIDAGIERNPAAGFAFPRTGSASVNVLPGVENFVIVRFTPAGRITGRVLDSAGDPVPNVTVAKPEQGGFSYVQADGNGQYEFVGLPLGEHTLSAPAPATGPGDNSDALIKKIASGNQDQLLAAIGEAFATFTGVNDPLLNGEGATFNPLTWGFVKTAIRFDGDTAVADIRFLREGTIAGTVLNGQGVPVGARVRLTGIGPMLNGDVGFLIRGERDSDPALGTFEFPGQALAGDFGLQSASPFFPTIASLSGHTTSTEPDARDLILQFPAARDVNGRLTGVVLKPDGSPAGADVNVKISFGNDFIIRTDATGRFDTQIALPAINSEGRPGVGYQVEASDPATGFRGDASVTVLPGIVNNVEVHLLGFGAMDVTVLKADGTAASGAHVEIRQGTFPRDLFSGTTDANGHVGFTNIFEGPYAVCGEFNTGTALITGRAGATVRAGATTAVTVSLGPTATIRGIFLARDLVTPIGFAQVAVGNLGFATTGVDGRFSIAAIPLGTYRLLSQDPVTGRVATLAVQLSVDGEVREVQLVEQARGEVTGTVLNSFGNGLVAGAAVTLRSSGNLAPPRTITSGPDGTFSFPGTPSGEFALEAVDPVSGLRGTASAVLPDNATTFALNVQIQPQASLPVLVLRPVGQTPATSATVRLTGGSSVQTADTDQTGHVVFSNFPLGLYKLRATSTILAENRSAVEQSIDLEAAGPASEVTLRLPGVGIVQGQVRQANGTTPAANAEVTLTMESELFKNVTETRSADGSGNYSFANVPVGPFHVTAQAQALGATGNGAIGSDGDTQTINLTLSQSGTVLGRLVRADGATPKSGVDVLLSFNSQSQLPGRSVVRTGDQGEFRFTSIPVGAFSLEAIASDVSGIARLSSSLTTNGQELDLGNIRLDEEDPHVVSVTPPNATSGVAINTTIDLLFNEPLLAGSLNGTGVYVRSDAGTIPGTLQLLPASGDGAMRLVRFTPAAPLASVTTYEIVVVDGERVNATGAVIATGIKDLVQRTLVAPFVARFTTGDQTPPALLSFTPENGTVQVDPTSVVRLSFNEPLQPNSASITLSGPNGPVAGDIALGISGQVLVFTPAVTLPANATFTATVTGVRDLAGNLALNQPLTTTFNTIDTLAPAISDIQIKNGVAPIAGANVILQAVVPQPEAGTRIRMTADFALIGDTAVDASELPFTLPPSGSVTIRAMTIDRFGNFGVTATKAFTILPNSPPALNFERLFPLTGSIPTGGGFSVKVSATDDAGVAELRAAVTNAAVVPVQTTSGAAITLSGTVRPDAGPSDQVAVLAQARDSSGASTGEQQFLIPIRDATPPTVIFSGAIPTSSFLPGETVSLGVRGRDAFGVMRYSVTAAGAFTGTADTTVAPASADDTRDLTFNVPADAPLTGTLFTLSVRAFDAAGNNSVPVVASLKMRDLTPPQVASIVPASGATNVTTLPTIVVTLTEPVSATSVNSTTFRLEHASDSAAIPSAVLLQPNMTEVRVIPNSALSLNDSFRLTVTTGVLDLSDNALASAVTSTFTTSDFRFGAPAVGAKAVEGQTIPLAIAPADFAAARVRFFVNGAPLASDATSAPFQSSAIVPPLAQVPGGTMAVRADAFDAANNLLASTQSTVAVFGVNGDADGDGLLNGAELAAGSDPFRADADEDPDNDGLTNAQEIAHGTNALDPDTDHDGLKDGVEVALGTNPLKADTDGDGLTDGLEVNVFGTNPLLADTDGDGLSDGFEVGVGRITIVSDVPRTWLAAKADAEARGGHLLTLTSAAENTAFVALFGTRPESGGAWIGHTDRFVEGAFRTVTGEQTTFTNFAPGEPNNIGDEDAVQLNSDPARKWIDLPETGFTGNYILETGFYTNPLVPDTDGDGLRDNVDPTPGILNRAPTGVADAFSTSAGQARVIPSSAVLANDTDPDGDPLAVTGVTAPAHGSAVLEANGTQIRYTPQPAFGGSDSFTYTLVDAGGLTSTATVTINVSSNHRPVAGIPIGVDNRGLQFDGSDDQATGPLLASIADNFTFEAWVKPSRTRANTTEANGGINGLFLGEYAIAPTHGTNSLGGDPHAGSGLCVGTNGFAVVEHAANYLPALLVFDTPVNDWTHVAVVYENKQPTLYVNGVQVRTGLVSTRIVHPSTELSSSLGHYQGLMDEFRVWDHVRTSQEIAADFGRQLSGTEPGLAVYWRMNELGGTTLFSSEPAARNGTLTGGTARITPGAPVLTFGQEVTVVQDKVLPITLIGSDVDGDPLAGDIKSLPAHGHLFQRASGGGTGVEITTVPVVVSDLGRRVYYQPNTGFVGDDSFAFAVHDAEDESTPATAIVHVVPDFFPLADDLWDVSRGTTVTTSTGTIANSSPANMFGATGGVEPTSTIFADGRGQGFTHAVEWRTSGLVRVEGARLIAGDDGAGGGGQRGFTEMRLFGRFDASSAYTLLAIFRPGENPYFPGTQELKTILNFAPFVGQEFRAEFDQFGNFQFGGPRITELDAIGETVVLVPGIQNLALQNATATFSQSGFPASSTIDGDLSSNSGWAVLTGGTSQTIVWETTADLPSAADTELGFNLLQSFGQSHFLGCFRISATTDPRSEFADGLGSGGDVTANWVPLDFVSVSGTGGETATILADKSVLIGGPIPNSTTYTVKLKGIVGNITGFRLEALTNPALPNNGPGRANNGNFVLGEVIPSKSILVPNRAPRPVDDSVQTTQNIPVTTGNVLANDTDPEGDPITVFDFTPPAAGTGSVVNNSDGTFTYTPPNSGFTGTATFSYRVTDGHQVSSSALVVITVVPSVQRVWINASGGNWSNPANWLNGILPGPNDLADITLAGTYTVTLDIDPVISQLVMGNSSGTQTLNVNGHALTIADAATTTAGAIVSLASGTLIINGPASLVGFSFTGGTLAGTGTVTITGNLSWTSGVMTGSGKTILPAGCVAALTTGGGKTLDNGRRLINQTTLAISGGSLNLQNSSTANATFENQGILNFTDDADINWSNFTTSRPVFFINSGTINKTGAGTTTDFGPTFFTNTGIINLNEGTLRLFDSVDQSGSLIAAAGTTLLLQADAFTLSPGAILSSAGSVFFNSTNLILNEPVNFSQLLTISGGTLTINVDQTFPALAFTGGTLAGTGTVTITGNLSWTSGVMTGSGKTVLPAGCVAALTTGGGKTLDNGRRLINQTTLAISGGSLNLQNSSTANATFENQGILNFTDDADINWSNFTSSRPVFFINSGTINKTGAGTTTDFGPTFFTNTGIINLNEGTLRLFDSVDQSGSLIAAAGTTLLLQADAFTLSPGAILSSAGSVLLNTTNLILNEPVNFSQLLTISGGTLTINVDQTFPALAFTGGTLAGTGTVTITGNLSWTSGVMTGSGKTILPAGCVAALTTGGGKTLDNGRRLINQTTLAISGGSLNLQNSSTANATFENQGILNFTDDADINWSNFTTSRPVFFINSGTINKTGAGTTTDFGPTFFTNTGIINLNEGTLRLFDSVDQSGSLIAAAGTTLLLQADAFTLSPGAILSSAGSVLLNTTNLILNEPVNFSQLLTISGGTLTINVDQTFPALAFTGGTLAGTGTVTITGNLSWTSGVMTGSGKTILPAGCVAALTTGGGKTIDNGRRLINQTTLTINGGSLNLQNSSTANATFENQAILNIIDDADINWSNFTSSRPVFVINSGTINKTGAGTTTDIGPTTITTTGKIDVGSGTLRLPSGVTQTAGLLRLSGGSIQADQPVQIQGGVIDGTGTITGSVSNGGTLAPTGTGTINITGGYSQTAAGVLSIQLGGTATSSFDRLVVGGAASLDGTLAVSLVNGFTPQSGDVFPILGYSSRLGDFATNTGLNQGSILLAKQFSATALTLTASGVGGSRFAAGTITAQDVAAIDADGDGQSDADEELAGTDPSDPLSRLAIDAVMRAGANVEVKFRTIAGRRYILESCDDLRAADWQTLASEFVGTGKSMTVIDPSAALLPGKFYRLRVSSAMSAVSGFIQPALHGRISPVSSPFFGEVLARVGVVEVSASTIIVDTSLRLSGRVLVSSSGDAGVSWLLPVLSQQGDRLKLDTRGAELGSLVQAGAQVELSALPTLGTLFSGNLDVLQKGSSLADSDRLQLWNGRGWDQIFHTGRAWKSPDAPGAQDDLGVPPGEGLLIVRKAAKDARLWFAGELRHPGAQLPIARGSSSFFGFTTGASLPLHDLFLPGLRSSRFPTQADLVRPWLQDHFVGCWYDGTSWRRVGTGANANQLEIPRGGAALIERRK